MAKKIIDPKKYCTQLINPPDNKHTYTIWAKLYQCRITEKPCVARDFYDTDVNSNNTCTYFPQLHEDLLEKCPSRNLSNKLANEIIVFNKQKEISKLEEEITNLK